mmetsp:Transcript_66316/g.105021  ORF Transcript_66316/g.105021 Transcript_66316/m.105021 type:complete len:219 (-) Transcript_66316:114-770(-)
MAGGGKEFRPNSRAWIENPKVVQRGPLRAPWQRLTCKNGQVRFILVDNVRHPGHKSSHWSCTHRLMKRPAQRNQVVAPHVRQNRVLLALLGTSTAINEELVFHGGCAVMVTCRWSRSNGGCFHPSILFEIVEPQVIVVDIGALIRMLLAKGPKVSTSEECQIFLSTLAQDVGACGTPSTCCREGSALCPPRSHGRVGHHFLLGNAPKVYQTLFTRLNL